MTKTQEIAAERPNRCPMHPGILLRETVLPALRLQQSHDLWKAQAALKEELEHIPSCAA